jgi:hypothetical protein
LAKEYILAGSKGAGVQRLAESVSLGAAVHPDATKIGPKRCFHLCARLAIERLPPAARHLDSLLYLRRRLCCAIALPGYIQDPLHETVPILTLQSQQ